MKIKDEAADAAWSAFTSLGVYASDKARLMKALEAALPHLSQGGEGESEGALKNLMSYGTRLNDGRNDGTLFRFEGGGYFFLADQDALPHLSQGAVRTGNEGLVERLRNYAKHDGHSSDAHVLLCGAAHEAADRLSSPSPAPGVTDEMVEIVAKKVADFLGYAWEGLNSHSVVEQGFRMFTHGQFGSSFHGGQPDLRNVARDLLEAALASHEPAPPTDPQEGQSEAGEVVAYLMEGSTVTWLQSTSGLADCDKPSVTPVPLVRQSALTACQQEVEALREGIKEIAERERGIRDNWTRFEAETGARTLELQADLEVANDKVERLRKALEEIASDDEHGDYEGVVQFARAALGGQSNG